MYKFNKKDPKPCPLCNSNDLTEVSNIDRNGNPLKTDMCQSCGHVFSNPPPKRKDLELFYKKITVQIIKVLYIQKRNIFYAPDKEPLNGTNK